MYWLVLDVIKNTYNQNEKKLIKAGTRCLSTFLGKWFVKTELECLALGIQCFKGIAAWIGCKTVFLSAFVISNCFQVPISRCQMSDE